MKTKMYCKIVLWDSKLAMHLRTIISHLPVLNKAIKIYPKTYRTGLCKCTFKKTVDMSLKKFP